jgi:hypothetical protein
MILKQVYEREERVFTLVVHSNVRGLNALPLNLLPASEVYAESAYTDYTIEDDLYEESQISLKVMRTHVFQAQG